ncbi:MAG: Tellurite resistance protein TerB [bacterium ADurb.Bin429]|nr:MAG: Tellurite resistance protein TerB [bacterium ADurb.Bin429]
MSPGQRANYLHWLTTGKTGPLHDIGYAFVYFYGLERRVLIDEKDVNTIIPEVVRLLRQYPESGSFHGYLSRFIAFVAARTGLNHMTPEGFALCFEQAPLRGYPEELLAVILCWFYMRDLPLSARWAFEVARQDIRTSRSVVVDRAPEQFQALFVQKYQEKYGEGMKLKVAARERSVEYHPASPSLLEMRYATTGFAPVRVPNVLGIQSQFKPIVQIWAECIEELRSYSRVLGKGADITTREAYEALPPALRKDVDHPDAPQWQSMASAHAREDGLSLIPISILAQIQGIEEREKLTPTQSQTLACTAEDIGFAIVPDIRNTGRPYAWSDKVFLFHPEGHPAVRKESGYHAAACMLELGMTIAGADGKVEQDELEHIEKFLEAQFQLSPDEVRRLEAYGLLLSQSPPTVASQSKQLREALTTEQRELIGKYLVGVAAANGIIDRKEISTLKAVYKALEIESGVLDALLTELRHSSSQPVEVQTGKRDTRPGEVIPARERTPVEITINDEALIRIMAETAEVSRILGQALCDAESDTVADDPIAPQPQTPSMVTGLPVTTLPFTEEQLSALDARYHAPLAELLARSEWSADEMATLAKRHLVMPSGMLDAINTWADETLGDILIEDGDVYTINLSLVEA